MIAFYSGSQAEEKVSLICPTGYSVKGQAWFAESPDKNTVIREVRISKEDNNRRLTVPEYKYQPQEYSVCAICINFESFFEVEMCITHETMRKENLAYERRAPSNDGQYGTVVWHATVDPIGLKIDMSKKDLLLTLQSIEAVTDSSLQDEKLSCPTGFKLDKFQSIQRVYKYPKFQTIFPCIVCSGPNGLFSSSSCVADSRNTYYGSLLLSSLFYNGNCTFQMHPSQNGCQLEPSQSGKDVCGVNYNPQLFLHQIWYLSSYPLNSNCLGPAPNSKYKYSLILLNITYEYAFFRFHS